MLKIWGFTLLKTKHISGIESFSLICKVNKGEKNRLLIITSQIANISDPSEKSGPGKSS